MNLQDLDSEISFVSKPTFKLCLRTLYLYLVHESTITMSPNTNPLNRMANALYSQIEVRKSWAMYRIDMMVV